MRFTLQKSIWLAIISSYFSRCFVISSFINVSRVLPSTKVTCTGLLYPGWLSHSFPHPISKMGWVWRHLLFFGPLVSSLFQRSQEKKSSFIEPVIPSVILSKIPKYTTPTTLQLPGILTYTRFILVWNYHSPETLLPSNIVNTKQKNTFR